ncbi:MAG: hypothetical protein ABTQ73_13745 [Caldilineales bacterium]
MKRYQWLILVGMIAALAALGGSRMIVSRAAPVPATRVQADTNPEGFKQIAAPPADFLSGMLRLPDPATLGLRSAYALLPVTLRPGTAGNLWAADIPVDDAAGLQWMLLAPPGSDWQLSLKPPQGEAMAVLGDSLPSGVRRSASTFGMGNNNYPAQVISFDTASPGLWRAEIRSAQPTRVGTQGFLVVANAGRYRLYSHLAQLGMIAGEPGHVRAWLTDEKAGTHAAPAAVAVAQARVTGELLSAAGTASISSTSLAFSAAESDGVYQAVIPPLPAGSYTLQISMTGQTPAGAAFVRTTEHLVMVTAGGVGLGTQAQAAPQDDVRLRIELPVTGTDSAAGRVVRVAAEVWGIGAEGKTVPVAWVSSLVTIGSGQMADGLSVALTLDGHWIALAGARAPFELRHVRLQDRDNFTPLAVVATMPLAVRALPASVHQLVDQPTGEMLQGARPGWLTPAVAAPADGDTINGNNHALMLVHGYCSSDVWATGLSNGNFTNAQKFLDLNQNRTHDQFALLIQSFGLAQLKSYGIVAHSQGGAASLHLYATYWSGLDWVDFDVVDGTRLIQSLGTPYQGTALAGSLAWLGNIFGTGCGSNDNLTYDGAATWLSTIPTWARSKVYYYTTGEDSIWAWNSCTGADFLLDDPNDGVTENNYAQLSGANNMGYTDEQCHVTGAPYIAQYHYATRNSAMNTAAKR